jgi:bacterioferritin
VALIPKIGASVKEHLEFDLKDELEAVEQYNNAVKVCREAADDGSRELFEPMIQDEERHTDFLEAQLHSIQEMGIANYLSEQMRGK